MLSLSLFHSLSLHGPPGPLQDSTVNPTDCLGRAGMCYNFVLFCFFFFGTEQHFPEVMLGEEFLSLSLDQVCSLISSDKLTVSSEEKV